MSRDLGTASIGISYNVNIAQPFDTRLRVPKRDDLTKLSNWMYNGLEEYNDRQNITYSGMLVVVYDDSDYNGVYRLVDRTLVGSLEAWVRIADASEVLTEEEINGLIDQKLEGFEITDEYDDTEVKGLIAGNTTRIESLETVVGNSDGGLVKTVNAQAESIGTINETLGKLDDTYAKGSDLSSYAKADDLKLYATTTFVTEHYADKQAVTNLSNTVNSTSDGLQSKLSIDAAANTYLTKTDASTTYAKSQDVNDSLYEIETNVSKKLNTDAAKSLFMSIDTWGNGSEDNELSKAYVKKYAKNQAAAAKTYADEQDKSLKASIIGDTLEVLTLAGLLERIEALENKLNEVSGPAEIQIVAVDSNGIEHASDAIIPYDSTIDKFVITYIDQANVVEKITIQASDDAILPLTTVTTSEIEDYESSATKTVEVDVEECFIPYDVDEADIVFDLVFTYAGKTTAAIYKIKPSPYVNPEVTGLSLKAGSATYTSEHPVPNNVEAEYTANVKFNKGSVNEVDLCIKLTDEADEVIVTETIEHVTGSSYTHTFTTGQFSGLEGNYKVVATISGANYAPEAAVEAGLVEDHSRTNVYTFVTPDTSIDYVIYGYVDDKTNILEDEYFDNLVTVDESTLTSGQSIEFKHPKLFTSLQAVFMYSSDKFKDVQFTDANQAVVTMTPVSDVTIGNTTYKAYALDERAGASNTFTINF